MTDGKKPCLVSCSVLKNELQDLVRRGDIDADLIFVSKRFHTEYALLEKNLRQVLKRNLPLFSGRLILVYGDLCLGLHNEMEELAKEYGVTKVNAANCVDCLLGGKGKYFEVDPTHKLLLLDPGYIGILKNWKQKALQEGIDEETLKEVFGGLEGIMFFSTLGEAEKNLAEIEKLNLGLPVLHMREIGLGDLKLVISEAIERNNST